MKLQKLKKHEGFGFEINRKLLEHLLRVIITKPRGVHTCALLQGSSAELFSPSSSAVAAAAGASTCSQQQAVGGGSAERSGRDEQQPSLLDGDMYVCEACQLLVRLDEQLVALLELVVPFEQLTLPDSQPPPIEPLVSFSHPQV